MYKMTRAYEHIGVIAGLFALILHSIPELNAFNIIDFNQI